MNESSCPTRYSTAHRSSMMVSRGLCRTSPRQLVHVADELGIGGELTDAVERRGQQPRMEPRDHAIDPASA